MSYQVSSFLTDIPGTPSCDMNNCRCGSSKNCMYYNDGVKSHYNYVSVQGQGSVENPEYRCMNKAFDYLNAMDYYDDHARGGLGAYGDDNLYGEVNYNDSKCSEASIGKRDMCSKCTLTEPNFYGDECNAYDPETMPDKFKLNKQVDVGFNVGGYGLDVEMRRWVFILAVFALLYFLDKRNYLPAIVGDLINTKVMGHTLLAVSTYLLIGYVVLAFFF